MQLKRGSLKAAWWPAIKANWLTSQRFLGFACCCVGQRNVCVMRICVYNNGDGDGDDDGVAGTCQWAVWPFAFIHLLMTQFGDKQQQQGRSESVRQRETSRARGVAWVSVCARENILRHASASLTINRSHTHTLAQQQTAHRWAHTLAFYSPPFAFILQLLQASLRDLAHLLSRSYRESL